jgi:leucyl aminopeptidase
MFVMNSFTKISALGVLLPLLTASTLAIAEEKKLWITIGSDAQYQATQVGAQLAPALQYSEIDQLPVLIYQANETQLQHLTHVMHEQKHRCGGYIVHSSYQEAVDALQGPKQKLAFNAPPIQHSGKVNALLPQIEAGKIKTTIQSLSGFTNRYYTSSTGKQAADWLASHWGQLASPQAWASVESYNHSGWGQDSVILKITGSRYPDEILVMGGHLDSTAGYGTGEGTVAPGADDDASGIASLTNVARALLDSGEQPQRSIHIMGYAAEEVGLRGSSEIAAAYKARGEQVLAALQLDMTNYHGSTEDIVFIADYVDSNFTLYMKQLLDTYQPQIVYGDDSCGYACSDHASWYDQGYPTTMPFESNLNDYNPNIHSRHDTLANSDSEAENSVPFARLALSFAIEMGNPDAGGTPIEPVASFTTQCNELSCQFDSSPSSGEISSYQWSFGDGNASSATSPVHAYGVGGQYQVTLTVTDINDLSDSDSQSISVSEGYATPVAGFESSVDGLSVSFTNTSTDADDDIVSYSWNFGDTGTSVDTNPTHSYASAGRYAVSLTATDSEGNTDTANMNVDVFDGDITAEILRAKLSRRGSALVDLAWDGANGSSVAIYRDGEIVATTNNDGRYRDRFRDAPASVVYKICQAGTSLCSDPITAQF